MKLFKNLIAPLLIAFIALIVLTLTLLNSGEARADSTTPIKAADTALTTLSGSNETQIVASAVISALPGSDVQLAGANSRLPEVAANDDFVAVVYEQGNPGQVYLRAAETGWGSAKLVDSANNGNSPKVAFKPSTTNTVHVVWTGFNGAGQYKAIRHVQCTLAEPTIDCGDSSDIHTIASTSFSTVTLQSPDVVVDDDDRIHVVWVEYTDTGSSLKSVRSTANDGSSWGNIATENLGGDDNGGQPSLAVTSDHVHLVYRDQAGGIWNLNYLRAGKADNPHNWQAVGTLSLLENEIAGSGHSKMSNPTIAASENNLYIVFDAQNDTDNTIYGLIGIAGTNGSLRLTLDNMEDITGTHSVDKDSGTPPSDHRSKSGAVPAEEDTLRPSIGVNTSGEFEVVWQERQAQDCSGGGGFIIANDSNNGTSEIFYAADESNGWTTNINILSDNSTEYSIDPDIAFDSSGRHIVFMKATSIPTGADCKNGGDSFDYGIYYRGPFTTFVSSGVYLPIIMKKS